MLNLIQIMSFHLPFVLGINFENGTRSILLEVETILLWICDSNIFCGNRKKISQSHSKSRLIKWLKIELKRTVPIPITICIITWRFTSSFRHVCPSSSFSSLPCYASIWNDPKKILLFIISSQLLSWIITSVKSSLIGSSWKSSSPAPSPVFRLLPFRASAVRVFMFNIYSNMNMNMNVNEKKKLWILISILRISERHSCSWLERALKQLDWNATKPTIWLAAHKQFLATTETPFAAYLVRFVTPQVHVSVRRQLPRRICGELIGTLESPFLC